MEEQRAEQATLQTYLDQMGMLFLAPSNSWHTSRVHTFFLQMQPFMWRAMLGSIQRRLPYEGSLVVC
jgi:hypothetical protein